MNDHVGVEIEHSFHNLPEDLTSCMEQYAATSIIVLHSAQIKPTFWLFQLLLLCI